MIYIKCISKVTKKIEKSYRKLAARIKIQYKNSCKAYGLRERGRKKFFIFFGKGSTKKEGDKKLSPSFTNPSDPRRWSNCFGNLVVSLVRLLMAVDSRTGPAG